MNTATKTREAIPAVTITVTPQRIGRDNTPEPFTVNIPQHTRPTAQILAERIHKHVRLMLLSDNYEVVVDFKKNTFSINKGRFGRGSFTTETGD